MVYLRVLVRVVLVQQEYDIYIRSCSINSALRGTCSSSALVWLCSQRADDALPSLVAGLLLLPWRLKACSCVLVVLLQQYGNLYSLLFCRQACMLLCTYLTLCHRSSRARMLLCTRGVGTAVWYLYSTLLACFCVLVVLVQQHGIYTRSCSVALKACSCPRGVCVGTAV